jgi:hypothetical protein
VKIAHSLLVPVNTHIRHFQVGQMALLSLLFTGSKRWLVNITPAAGVAFVTAGAVRLVLQLQSYLASHQLERSIHTVTVGYPITFDALTSKNIDLAS